MFLLGLLAVAFLPLLITSMQTTVLNSTVSTATQLVEEQMNKLRVVSSAGIATCASLVAAPAEVIDRRSVKYQPRRTVTCPSVYPGTAKVVVSVSLPPATTPAVTATTLVYVTEP
jgi:type II secretory pathway pseudopilin PulG